MNVTGKFGFGNAELAISMIDSGYSYSSAFPSSAVVNSSGCVAADDDLDLQSKCLSRFDEREKRVVRSLLEGMILKHEARRWQTVSNGGGRR